MKRNSLVLHRRSIRDKIKNEVIRNLGQVLQHFNGSVNEIGLVVLDTPFLAETFDKVVSLFQVVTRQGGEQVMIDLVLETTAEPIDKGLRESMSSRNVTSRGNLKLPEVGTSVGIVRRHTVVSKTKHNGQKETTRAGHEQKERQAVRQGETSETRAGSKDPNVVENDSNLFEDGVL